MNSNKLFVDFFKPDSIYEFAWGIKSFDEYLKRYKPDFTLIDNIPSDVRNEIETVESLFCCGYINYKLIDEALSKLTRVFELCLKMYFKQETTFDWTDKNFHCDKKKSVKRDLKNLIDWIFDNYSFDTDRQFLHLVREHLRNSYAHPENHSFGGTMISHWFSQIMIFINELFEGEQSRKLRIQYVDNVRLQLEQFKDKLSILEHDEKRILIHHNEILFTNAQNDVSYFCFIPLFDIEEIVTSNYALTPKVFFIEIKNLKIENGEIIATSTNYKPLKLYFNSDVRNDITFSEWHKKLFDIKDENRMLIQANINYAIERYQQKIRIEYFRNFINK